MRQPVAPHAGSRASSSGHRSARNSPGSVLSSESPSAPSTLYEQCRAHPVLTASRHDRLTRCPTRTEDRESIYEVWGRGTIAEIRLVSTVDMRAQGDSSETRSQELLQPWSLMLLTSQYLGYRMTPTAPFPQHRATIVLSHGQLTLSRNPTNICRKPGQLLSRHGRESHFWSSQGALLSTTVKRSGTASWGVNRVI